MKTFYTLISIYLLGTFQLSAQVTASDSITLLPGYLNQSFYSMQNGEVSSPATNDWDIAFALNQRVASIITNGGFGAQLFELQNSDTANWSAIDTMGMTPLYNSDTTWEEGAFNAYSSGFNPVNQTINFGWGTYSLITHNLTGEKVFVIRTVDGDLKKIWIKKLLQDAEYQFIYENLDGSGTQTDTIHKADYSGKNFVYFNLSQNLEIDKEPAKTDWDLVFRKYMTLVDGAYYPVTGILSNDSVWTAEARGVDVETVNHTNQEFSNTISNIGSDWKDYDFNTNQWTLESDLAFFVQDMLGDVYKLVFTRFGGSASGDVVFYSEKVSAATGISFHQADKESQITLYPNPSAGVTNLLFFSGKREETQLKIYSISGKKVFSKKLELQPGLNNFFLGNLDLADGTYLVKFEKQGISTSKLLTISK